MFIYSASAVPRYQDLVTDYSYLTLPSFRNTNYKWCSHMGYFVTTDKDLKPLSSTKENRTGYRSLYVFSVCPVYKMRCSICCPREQSRSVCSPGETQPVPSWHQRDATTAARAMSQQGKSKSLQLFSPHFLTLLVCTEEVLALIGHHFPPSIAVDEKGISKQSTWLRMQHEPLCSLV